MNPFNPKDFHQHLKCLLKPYGFQLNTKGFKTLSRHVVYTNSGKGDDAEQNLDPIFKP